VQVDAVDAALDDVDWRGLVGEALEELEERQNVAEAGSVAFKKYRTELSVKVSSEDGKAVTGQKLVPQSGGVFDFRSVMTGTDREARVAAEVPSLKVAVNEQLLQFHRTLPSDKGTRFSLSLLPFADQSLGLDLQWSSASVQSAGGAVVVGVSSYAREDVCRLQPLDVIVTINGIQAGLVGKDRFDRLSTMSVPMTLEVVRGLHVSNVSSNVSGLAHALQASVSREQEVSDTIACLRIDHTYGSGVIKPEDTTLPLQGIV
jgi:hypothetical protein